MSLSQRLDVPPRLEMARSSDDREAQYSQTDVRYTRRNPDVLERAWTYYGIYTRMEICVAIEVILFSMSFESENERLVLR